LDTPLHHTSYATTGMESVVAVVEIDEIDEIDADDPIGFCSN
jgi:hypothetical protein